MAGWFVLKETNTGHKFDLKAGNGETILTSEVYESKAGAENGIESVQKNSPNADRYDKKESANGKFYFTLEAGNHQVIGTSEMYESASSRDNGIESVMANGPTETVKEG